MPTDWNILVFYHLNRFNAFGSSEIKFRSWVSELEAGDVQKIKKVWQPTSAEYISPQERARRKAIADAEAEKKR